jgi:hypothetical protein
MFGLRASVRIPFSGSELAVVRRVCVRVSVQEHCVIEFVYRVRYR